MAESKEVTFSPEINDNSRKLAEKNEPLHLRWQEEVEKREKKISIARSEKCKKEEIEIQKMLDRQKKIEEKILYSNDKSDSPYDSNRKLYSKYNRNSKYITKDMHLHNNALSIFFC